MIKTPVIRTSYDGSFAILTMFVMMSVATMAILPKLTQMSPASLDCLIFFGLGVDLRDIVNDVILKSGIGSALLPPSCPVFASDTYDKFIACARWAL